MSPDDRFDETHSTQDLAEQIQRANSLADETKEIEQRIAERRQRRPPAWFLKAAAYVGSLAVLSWTVLAAAVAAVDGDRVGRPIAILIALSASLTISGAILFGAGSVICVINGKASEGDKIATYLHRRAMDDRANLLRAIAPSDEERRNDAEWKARAEQWRRQASGDNVASFERRSLSRNSGRS